MVATVDVGHPLHFRDVRVRSAFHPIASKSQTIVASLRASGLGRNEVGRRAKRAPLAIGRGLPGVGRLDDFECIAAEQQAYGRIVHSDDLEGSLGPPLRRVRGRGLVNFL